MKAIIKRLGEDMRWRLSGAGKSFAPNRKEVESWGAAKIPGAAGCLAWLALSTLNYAWINGIVLSGLNTSGGGVALGLLSLPVSFGATMFVNILLLPVVFMVSALLQSRRNLAAYKSVLQTNERFMLVEYVKYLERQAGRLRLDTATGSAEEARRLLASAAQIRSILASQSSAGGANPVPTSSDSTLAQSVVEAYSAYIDPLKALDLRLSDEQRLKVQDLERGLEMQDAREKRGANRN